MADDYIKRKYVLEGIKASRDGIDWGQSEDGDAFLHYSACLYRTIASNECVPSADVAKVRHGKWEHDTDGLPRCSHCDEIALQRIMLHFPANQYFSQFVHSNFCPHCGARMDGE